MRRITDFIVDHCYLVLVIMVAIAGLSAFISQNVKINHDITAYMPDSSETSQGKKIMDEEFGDVATSNYTIMFENLDDSEKNSMKEYFESVDGVDKVSYDETEEYNREKDGKNYTLYSIDVKGGADDETAKKVYSEIHNKLKSEKNDEGDEKYIIYEKGDVATSNGAVVNVLIIVLAVGVALVIITIMSESFIEPWLYLTSILIAVLINKGTNIIFPNVSHITDSIAAVLQLALSMDYSIMLAERYRQERATEKDKKKAMHEALAHAFGSISASSVTTIVGLIVLIFMSFTIGRDMGFVLSKGVLLSLISIFTTLPAFLLIFDKWIMNSKKKAPRFDMSLLGKYAHKTRFVAIPAFLIILFGSMILKGSVGIEYTGASNNIIGDVFDETNQIAIIYNNEDEARLAGICKTYNEHESVKQALCFGNTIGEQKKYNELKEKASELGADVNVDDYLIKVLYYHYYDPNEKNTMSLEELVTFIQNNVLNNENFSSDVDANTRSQIDRLSNFTVASKIHEEKTLGQLAQLFEMDEASLRKIFTLYGNNEVNSGLGRAVSGSTMTLAEFVNFINNNVLKNPEYAGEINASARAKINLLTPFVDKNRINSEMNVEELSNFLGVSKESIEKIFAYQAYQNHLDDVAKMQQQMQDVAKAQIENTMKSEATVNAITNEVMSHASEIQQKVTEKATEMALAGTPMTQEEIAEYQKAVTDEIKKTVTDKYIEQATNNVKAAMQPIIEQKTAEFEQKMFEEGKTYKSSPVKFVNYILEHQNDEKIAPNLTNEMKQKLNLAKTVMDAVNNNRRFTYTELAKTFGLNADQLRLLYSLNYFENLNKNPRMSVKTLVDFINGQVLTNEKYSGSISSDKREKLGIITDLMNHALAGDRYNHTEMYYLLTPLSNSLKKELVDLLYMYHGSLYNYDENWTLSLEQFVNYLHGTIVKDERFSNKIDSEKRDTIERANTKISDAKRLLVGKNHSRAVLNTNLKAEGDETFAFIEKLKNDINNENAHVFVIGDSPMAYEMSQTFNDEMNFITILTLVSIFVVVAFTFKSVLIPIILVLIIQSAVWITMSILSITGSSVYFIALIIVQSILMGATIDYAILYTSYYLEHRKKNIGMKQALIDSYNKSLPTIITSASVLVIVTYIVGSFDKQGSAIAAKICVTISEGTLCSAILILLILPALLASCDKIILRRKNK